MPDHRSPTIRGDSPVVRGRVVHARSVYGGGAPIAASDWAVGAGFGTTPGTVTVTQPSTDTRGTVTVTCGSGSLAQATATLTLTFAGGSFVDAPTPFCRRTGGTAAGAVAANATATTTTLVLTVSTLPVAAETQTYEYLVQPYRTPVV
jgi:hypothetical protein